MKLLERINRILRTDIQDLIAKKPNKKKITLESAFEQMEAELSALEEQLKPLKELINQRKTAPLEKESHELRGVFVIFAPIDSKSDEWIYQAEDPEKVIDEAINELQEHLIIVRKAVAQLIASQKRMNQEYNRHLADANDWQRKTELVMQRGDENLARQALERKKTARDAAYKIEPKLQQMTTHINEMKEYLTALESEIWELKSRKDYLKARYDVANSLKNIAKINCDSAFDRMEVKVITVEIEAYLERAISDLLELGTQKNLILTKWELDKAIQKNLILTKGELDKAMIVFQRLVKNISNFQAKKGKSIGSIPFVQ